MGLSVVLQRGSDEPPLTSQDTLFYDETLHICLDAPTECTVHVAAVMRGRLPDRLESLVVTIFEDTVKRCKSWTAPLYIRHPRGPLQDPHLELLATIVDETPEERASPERTEETLPPLEPLSWSGLNFQSSPGLPEWASSVQPSLLNASNTAPTVPVSTHSMREGRPRSVTGSATGSLARSGSASVSGSMPPPSSRSSPAPSLRIRPQRRPSTTSKDSAPPDALLARSLADFTFRAPLTQALEVGIRCVRPVIDKNSVIAEIGVDSTRNVLLRSYEITIDEGTSEMMGTNLVPLELPARGSCCFSYAFNTLSTSNTLRHAVNIVIEYEILDAGSPKPLIRTVWTPLINFDDTEGPLPKTPMLAISSPPNPAHAWGNMPAASTRSSSTSLSQIGGVATRTVQPPLSGISLILTGPTAVDTGSQFDWTIKAINRSSRARKLALRFDIPDFTHGPDPASHPAGNDNRGLFVSSETLRKRDALHRVIWGANRGLMPLKHEVRLGMLAPSTCYETRLSLLARRQGYHSISYASIVDLGTGDLYEITDLLGVFVN